MCTRTLSAPVKGRAVPSDLCGIQASRRSTRRSDTPRKRRLPARHFGIAVALLFALSPAMSAKIAVQPRPALSLESFAQPTAISLLTSVHISLDVTADPANEDGTALSVYFVLTPSTDISSLGIEAYRIVPRVRPFTAPRSGLCFE
jgi:hypothetical protein